MSWAESFVAAGRAAEERAAAETCECGSEKTVGYSNLGIPVVCCPSCQPTLYANRKKPVGEAWGEGPS